MDLELLFKIHFSLTLYMLGIIYLIQAINYPLFALVDKDSFPNYHALHIRQTSKVIAIPMLLETITLIALLWWGPAYRAQPLFMMATVLLILIWLVTFLISVPLHNKLSVGFDSQVCHRLITTNWIRTIAWTIRAFMLFQLL